MNTIARYAALAAAAAALRASAPVFSDASIEVDEKTGVLRNVAVMNVGEARGHGFLIDATTLRQVAELINATGEDGIKVRFRHPQPSDDGTLPDDLGDVIGVVKNGRVVGESLRGDVHLGDYAEVLPGLGDVRTYLLRRAKSNPTSLGLSAVIGFDREPVTNAAGDVIGVVARVGLLDAIDIVGRGAATQNGLLSSKPDGPNVNATLRGILCQMGMQYDASEEAAKAFYDALSDDQKEAIQSQLKAIAAAAAVTAKEAAADAASDATLAAKSARTNPKAKTGAKNMDAKMKQYLSANHGLAADASDEDAQKTYDGLSDAQKAAMTAKLSEGDTTTDKGGAAQMAARQAPPADADAEFIALEQKRITGINQLVAALKQGGADIPTALIQQQIGANASLATARTAFLKHIAESCTPVQSIKVGEDRNRASLKASLCDAILIRAGQKVEKPADRAQQLASLTLIDMGRKFLAAYGVNEANDISRVKVWEMLAKPQRFGGQYAMLAQSTDSFANITLDAANKALRQEYMLAPSTWNLWARRATAPDFKNINRVQLSDVPGLVARKEGGEIKYNVLSDNKEVYTLAEYINGIRLTRQAIVNDDLDAFSRIPRAQATTAKQLEDDVCYAILTANATLSDTGALFNATAVTTAGGHANLSSATADVGAPSVTTLGLGRKLMRLQKGPKANLLNLSPKFLLVPAALETVADQYTSTNYVAAIQTSINPFAANGRTPLTPVVEPRLDASSSTAWYLAADNARIDTVEVCFLQDEQEPQLKQETDFDTDDLKFAVRHTVSAKAIDFRGLYKNNGA